MAATHGVPLHKQAADPAEPADLPIDDSAGRQDRQVRQEDGEVLNPASSMGAPQGVAVVARTPSLFELAKSLFDGEKVTDEEAEG